VSRVSNDRRLGVAVLIAGLVIALGAVRAGPSRGVPLYDGVVPVEPYRWLVPPPGQPGGAKGAEDTVAVAGARSPLISIATDEIPPQAQIFVVPGGLTLPAGAASLRLSIQPVTPEALPSDGTISGNVYRMSVVDQTGQPAVPVASAQPTVVLRAVDQATTDAVVERFDGSTWRTLETSASDLGASFEAVISAFGDFAVVLPGVAASTSPSGAAASTEASVGPSTATQPSPSAQASPEAGGSIGPLIRTAAPVALVLVVGGLVLAAIRRPSGRGSGGGRGGRRGR
jgi:hypothetical protein